ncbi:MAG: hypothetical protein V1735_02870 [Nanoarchaeota archaeon]
MPLFTFMEIVDIVIMTAFVGYIFKDAFPQPRYHAHDPVAYYTKRGPKLNAFWFAAMVTAPAIILHELGHKFMALGYGMHATFQAAYLWLAIGLFLKLINFGFIFFVPAFTSIMGSASPVQFSLVAFAGPGVNLVLWLGLLLYEKSGAVRPKHRLFVRLTRNINMFLFIFNMLPIPMFDGWTVYSGLIKTFF